MTSICVSIQELIDPFDKKMFIEDMTVLIEEIDTVIDNSSEGKKSLLYSLNLLKSSIESNVSFMFLTVAVSAHSALSLIKANQKEFSFNEGLKNRLDKYEDHMYHYLTEIVEKLPKDKEDTEVED